MYPASIPAPILATAPYFARQFGGIIGALAAIIASRHRDQRFAFLIVPLWGRLQRCIGRLNRLMAHLAAGRLPGAPASASPGPHRPRPHHPARARTPWVGRVFPTGRGWLVRALGWEAAGCGSQLEALLAEPAVAELLALVPTAGRLIRPMARMLGIGVYAPRPRAIRAAPPPPPPPEEFMPLGEVVSRSPGITWYRVPTPPLKPA